MTTADAAHVGAAALGVSAIAALCIFYIGYGLDHPFGPRVRIAAFILLAVTGIGYTVQWWIETVATETTATGYFAGLRIALALALVNFAVALYQEGKENE